jgi:hypothetical protein
MKRAVLAAADAVLANADEEAGRVAYVLQAGNPTDLRGALYDACTRSAPLWWVKEITADPDDPSGRAASHSVGARADRQLPRRPRAPVGDGERARASSRPGRANALISVDDASAASKRNFGRRRLDGRSRASWASTSRGSATTRASSRTARAAPPSR